MRSGKTSRAAKVTRGKAQRAAATAKARAKVRQRRATTKVTARGSSVPWNKEYWEEKDERPAKAAKW